MKKEETRGRKSKGADALSHTIAFKVNEATYKKLKAEYESEKANYNGVKYEFADYLRMKLQ